MWIRTQAGNLVNLDNCTAVRKHQEPSHRHYNDDESVDLEPRFSVLALDASPESTYALATKLTELQTSVLMGDLWHSVINDTENWFDIQATLS